MSQMEEKSLDHAIAEYARRCVEEAKSLDSDKKANYRSEARGLAAKIHGSGLMQTLAFLCSKMLDGRGNERVQYVKIFLHVIKGIPLTGDPRFILDWNERHVEAKELFMRMPDNSAAEMMFLTQRALKLASWLSRFAEISLEG